MNGAIRVTSHAVAKMLNGARVFSSVKAMQQHAIRTQGHAIDLVTDGRGYLYRVKNPMRERVTLTPGRLLQVAEPITEKEYERRLSYEKQPETSQQTTKT
tara:strand:- start:13373 stop:13672 length:300 start_codon:yes stop_codon:yes gene_type:complete